MHSAIKRENKLLTINRQQLLQQLLLSASIIIMTIITVTLKSFQTIPCIVIKGLIRKARRRKRFWGTSENSKSQRYTQEARSKSNKHCFKVSQIMDWNNLKCCLMKLLTQWRTHWLCWQNRSAGFSYTPWKYRYSRIWKFTLMGKNYQLSTRMTQYARGIAWVSYLVLKWD